MRQLIKRFSDNSILEYDEGKFDHWCVYLTRPDSKRYAPIDIEYFSKLKNLGAVHNSEKIYYDFVAIFNVTNKKIESSTLDFIQNIASEYGNDSLEIEILFTIVYAGMVAEENKAFTKLGKKVKRLGMHQVLIENLPPNTAADFSKGKSWREILSEYENRIKD